MNTPADKVREHESQSAAYGVSRALGGSEAAFHFADNRPEAVAQRKLQETANNRPQAKQLMAFQGMIDNALLVKQAARLGAMAGDSPQVANGAIPREENKNPIQMVGLGLTDKSSEEVDTEFMVTVNNYIVEALVSDNELAIQILLKKVQSLDSGKLAEIEKIIKTQRIIVKNQEERLAKQPVRSKAKDLGPTSVTPIDISAKVNVDVINLQGEKIGDEELVHPIFREIVKNQYSFVIVKLTGEATQEHFQESIPYKGKRYRIDMMAGSSIKPSKSSAGKVYGIEEAAVDFFKNMFGFEESAYYAQRALFPLVNAGVSGRVRGRAIPQEKGMKHTFLLTDGTKIQVDDGWGYIRRSLADKMQEGGMQYEKREPKEKSGHVSYQMTQWFDDEDTEVIGELVQQGLQQWEAAKQDYLLHHKEIESSDFFQSKKRLQSILTTGSPRAEMGVAIPVPGNNIVIPSGQGRYTKHLPGDVSVMRSPADKQNFRPVERGKVDDCSRISRLVGDIEGIQYTWTGRQDGLLTFFKGMLGIIEDDLWPIEWREIDVAVSSKDRKLFEKWQRDSSLEAEPEAIEDQEIDRASMSKSRQDFSISGTLAAVQWFKKGSFIGIPAEIQKWLGGDYDGDEIAMIFGSSNPMLQKYIKEKAFKEEQINPKLTKTFTYAPGGSRAKRISAMRSSNVGIWSNIATKVKSLPLPVLSWLAGKTKDGRLLSDDPELSGLSEESRMEKEIQLGIKVGTDAYKTSVDVSTFEIRARLYNKLLETQVAPIIHNNKLLDIIETAGVLPSLKIPAWRNLFFMYDEVDSRTGKHVVKGLSARVLRDIVWNLLPEDEKWNVYAYYDVWKNEDGFDITKSKVRHRDYHISRAASGIDQFLGDKEGTTSRIIRLIDFTGIRDVAKFQRAYLSVRYKSMGKPKLKYGTVSRLNALLQGCYDSLCLN